MFAEEYPDAESIHNLVRTEGRGARNLVTWSVPTSVEMKESKGGQSSESDDEADTSSLMDSTKRSAVPRPRRAQAKLVDLKSRYWAYLFDNLNRAIDEIYTTCETDESVLECEEVIMVMRAATNDFAALIRRFESQAAYERQRASALRPPPVAWEVRRISPGKQGGMSWADRAARGADLSASISSARGPHAGLTAASSAAAAATSSHNSSSNTLHAGSSGASTPAPGPASSAPRGPRGAAAADTHSDSDGNGADGGTGAESSGLTGGGEGSGGGGADDEGARGWADRSNGLDESMRRDRLEGSAGEDSELWLSVDGRDTATPPARSPGEALLLHQKLSSPSRKKPVELAARRAEEKQKRASEAREQMQREMAERLRDTNTVRVEQVRTRQRGRLTQETIEARLAKASTLRESQIELRRRRAHDEDAKVSEVAFIQKLGAMNRRAEVLEKQQGRAEGSAARLLDLDAQRRLRAQEKAARDEAVLARRMQLEDQRVAHLREVDQRRAERVQRAADARSGELVRRDQARLQRLGRVRQSQNDASGAVVVVGGGADVGGVEGTGADTTEATRTDAADRASDEVNEPITQAASKHKKKKKKKSKAAAAASAAGSSSAVGGLTAPMLCVLCKTALSGAEQIDAHVTSRRHLDALAGLGGSELGEAEKAMFLVALPTPAAAGSQLAGPSRVQSYRARSRRLRAHMAATCQSFEPHLFVDPAPGWAGLAPRCRSAFKDISDGLVALEAFGDADAACPLVLRGLAALGRQPLSKLGACEHRGMVDAALLVLERAGELQGSITLALPSRALAEAETAAVGLLQRTLAMAAPGLRGLVRGLVLGNRLVTLFDTLCVHLGRLVAQGEAPLFAQLATVAALVVAEAAASIGAMDTVEAVLEAGRLDSNAAAAAGVPGTPVPAPAVAPLSTPAKTPAPSPAPASQGHKGKKNKASGANTMPAYAVPPPPAAVDTASSTTPAAGGADAPLSRIDERVLSGPAADAAITTMLGYVALYAIANHLFDDLQSHLSRIAPPSSDPPPTVMPALKLLLSIVASFPPCSAVVSPQVAAVAAVVSVALGPEALVAAPPASTDSTVHAAAEAGGDSVRSVAASTKAATYDATALAPAVIQAAAGAPTRQGSGLAGDSTLTMETSFSRADSAASQGQLRGAGPSRDDRTRLVATLRETDLAGVVPLLYAVLFQPNVPKAPTPLSPAICAVVLASLRILNCVATLDLPMLQLVIGAEGTVQEMCLVFSRLLANPISAAFCPVLNELILLIGNFALLQRTNLDALAQPPAPVLAALAALPFAYFSDAALMDVLFPTLIAATYNCTPNLAMLSLELSPQTLAAFIRRKAQQALPATTANRFELSSRFPPAHWDAACEFFGRGAQSP